MAGPERTVPSTGPGRVGVVVIHGNGEAEPGWFNHSIIERLQQRLARSDAPERLAFADRSEVIELSEPSRPVSASSQAEVQPPPATFKAYIRRGETRSGASIAFVELNWSDLSSVADAPIAQILAALRLFYDAPIVLTRSFLPGCASWFHIVLRRLLLIAIAIVRWFVAGLNSVTFFTVFAITLVSLLVPPTAKLVVDLTGLALPTLLVGDHLIMTLVAIIALLVLLCTWLATLDEDRNFGLTDVWVATASAGVACISAIVVHALLSDDRSTWDVLYFVKPAIALNFFLGMAWDAVAVVAILMWLALCLKRSFRPATVDTPALWSVSAALGLCIVQAQVWKICVPAAGALTIQALGWGAPLASEFARLNGVGVLNSVLTAIDVALCVLLLRAGAWVRRLPWLGTYGDLQTAASRAPRVIIGALVIVALAAGTFANLYLHYVVEFGGTIGTSMFEPVCGRDNVSVCIAGSPWLKLFIICFGLAMLWLLAFGRLQSAFLAVVHFGRAIVDHQYHPDHAVARRAARSLPGGESEDYPRRERVRQRLDVLASRVLAAENFDRIILLAHSQGSVIAYDTMVSGSSMAKAVLNAPAELHVVTLGSPISHLYEHYFLDYAISASDPAWLPKNLASWTNLWRIDDPIARRVTLGAAGIVENIPLEPGGHDDYWREPEVCDTILTLLDSPYVVPAHPAGR